MSQKREWTCDRRRRYARISHYKRLTHWSVYDWSREEKGKVGPQVRRSDHWLETAVANYKRSYAWDVKEFPFEGVTRLLRENLLLA